MLTFELTENENKLCIHGDVDGLQSLIDAISNLVKHTKEGEFDHDHLMTHDWGGDELSAKKLDSGSTIINHVKLYCWKTNK